MSNRRIGASMLIAFPAVLIGIAALAAYFNSLVALGIGAVILMLWIFIGVYLIAD